MAIPLTPRVTDLGEFSVARVLPNKDKRMVGPFVFFDHMGPANFDAGQGVNVRPHPHIGLATLTYLLEGQILHRDSLGNCLEIMPGDVNWMVAGSGITHSERETLETQSKPHKLNGLQCWVALPKDQAEREPSFTHRSKFDLPHYHFEGLKARLVIGEAYGLKADIPTFSPMFLLDTTALDGTEICRPNPQQECLVYVAQGSLTLADGSTIDVGQTCLLDADEDVTAKGFTRAVFLGGEAWQEIPSLEWNFVSFSKERLQQAKNDWKAGRFPDVVGDDAESIPLPA